MLVLEDCRMVPAARRRLLYTALQSVKFFDDIHITCSSAHSGYNKIRYRRQVFVRVPSPSMAADCPNAVVPWTRERRDLQRTSGKLLRGHSFRRKLLFSRAVSTTDWGSTENANLQQNLQQNLDVDAKLRTRADKRSGAAARVTSPFYLLCSCYLNGFLLISRPTIRALGRPSGERRHNSISSFDVASSHEDCRS